MSTRKNKTACHAYLLKSVKPLPFSPSRLIQNRFNYTCLHFLMFVLIVCELWEIFKLVVRVQMSSSYLRAREAGVHPKIHQVRILQIKMVWYNCIKSKPLWCVYYVCIYFRACSYQWFANLWNSCLFNSELIMGASQSTDKMQCNRYLNGKGPPSLTEIGELLRAFCRAHHWSIWHTLGIWHWKTPLLRIHESYCIR